MLKGQDRFVGLNPVGLCHSKPQGFSLIELLTAVSIVGILAINAVPSMVTMVYQAKAKAKADSVVMGLQLARAEAFKRNASITVQFEPNGAASSNSITGGYTVGCSQTVYNPSAPNRLVSLCPGSAYNSSSFYSSTSSAIIKSPPEGGVGNMTATVSPATTGTVAATTFDNFGNLSSTNPDGSLSATTLTFNVASNLRFGGCGNGASGKSVCSVSVVVSGSGGIRICYPSYAAGTNVNAC